MFLDTIVSVSLHSVIFIFLMGVIFGLIIERAKK